MPSLAVTTSPSQMNSHMNSHMSILHCSNDVKSNASIFWQMQALLPCAVDKDMASLQQYDCKIPYFL
jgi:hypothetical protein